MDQIELLMVKIVDLSLLVGLRKGTTGREEEQVKQATVSEGGRRFVNQGSTP